MRINNKLLVIIGPTAAKKTTTAHFIAKSLNAQIINADAFQVYKQIDVSINKPSIEKRKEVVYHLIDYIDYDDPFDISIYQTHAYKIIDKLQSKNILPILCGGSHLYLDCIIKGYDLYKTNERQSLIDKGWDVDSLYEYLYKYDRDTALKIGKNNIRRLERNVQILLENNNQKIIELNNNTNKPKYECFVILVNCERDFLYDKINKRLENFYYNDNWKKHVADLINKYPDIVNSQAWSAIGYKEIEHAILNNYEPDLEKLKQKTRKLAKHQLTWAKNKFNINLEFNYYEDNISDLLMKIRGWLENE